MNIIESIIKFIFSFFGLEQSKSSEELKKEREQIIKIPSEKPLNIEKEIIKANVKRLKDALDYAVTLPYYFRGFGDDSYPDYVRTYEQGIIPIKEYEKLKKKDSDSIHLVTYCNVLARKIARGCFDYGLWDNNRDIQFNWMNWDLTAGFLNKSYSEIFYNILPNKAKEIILKSADSGYIKELNCKEAQDRANKGIFIWGVNEGHEIVVYPDFNEYDSDRGCKIAQAGWYNVSDVYISSYQCWGKNWKNEGIHFFEFPYDKIGFVDYLNLESI